MFLGEDIYGMQPIWEGLVSIYDEISRICDRHNLRYYVTDGTALGAVRHAGFIPWDDDLDVAMPRPDYNKFLRIASEELPEHLKIVTWKNTPEYNLLFAKVQETRRDYVQAIENQTGRMLSNGIYVDVFPIDGYPSDRSVAKREYRLFCLYRTLLRFKGTNFWEQSKKGKLVWLAGLVLSPFFPWLWSRECILQKEEASVQRITFDEAIDTGRSIDSYGIYGHSPERKSVWGHPTLKKVGEKGLMFPENILEHLQVRYGDYMKLPPEHKRKPAHQYSYRCAWWLGPTTSKLAY